MDFEHTFSICSCCILVLSVLDLKDSLCSVCTPPALHFQGLTKPDSLFVLRTLVILQDPAFCFL